ncbi:hypothetical protein [Spirosoma utsteinense]|uniref:Oligosaccharide repeat unit polymerase n=1 Tax=Spirosoma utsteinense TaxID=2585773 RepID=A0ABR6W6R5_9BACT|nr:hypothetical protein [Spirosoma utsteinense]MBC3786082.1 hypothetical protein [Spirosoma utsteinense]MBC3792271.1 hypothetical protein [Spirosoma utsteinense]
MIWLYALVNGLALLWGARYAWRVGLRTVIPFAMCLALLSVYCLLTPVCFYLMGRETVTGDAGYFRYVGKNIAAYYETGLFAYMVANLCFVGGFVAHHKPEETVSQVLPASCLPALRRFVVLLYGLFMAIVLVDIRLSGVSLVDVFLGTSEQALFSAPSVSNTYYFRAFADSIITTLVLYAYLGGRRSRLIALVVPAFVLFALLGFRYRLILTVLGLLLVYLFRPGRRINGWRWAWVSVTLIYFLLMITYNRWFVITGLYDRIRLNPVAYDYAVLLEQTRGSLADFNLLRYYAENPETAHDYGLSMFGYVVVQIVPRHLFPGGEKPYPSPFIDVLDKSLELPVTWARIGEASLHYGAFYAGFGWMGFVVLPGLMGWWISTAIRRNPGRVPLGFLGQVGFSLALFQFITRGYFPQFVDHFVYLFIPLWLIGSRIRKAAEPQSTIHPLHEAVH